MNEVVFRSESGAEIKASEVIFPLFSQGTDRSYRLMGSANAWLTAHPAANHQAAINHLKNLHDYVPSLRLKDAETCMATFRRLAELTAQGLRTTTGVGPANVW